MSEFERDGIAQCLFNKVMSGHAQWDEMTEPNKEDWRVKAAEWRTYRRQRMPDEKPKSPEDWLAKYNDILRDGHGLTAREWDHYDALKRTVATKGYKRR